MNKKQSEEMQAEAILAVGLQAATLEATLEARQPLAREDLKAALMGADSDDRITITVNRNVFIRYHTALQILTGTASPELLGIMAEVASETPDSEDPH